MDLDGDERGGVLEGGEVDSAESTLADYGGGGEVEGHGVNFRRLEPAYQVGRSRSRGRAGRAGLA